MLDFNKLEKLDPKIRFQYEFNISDIDAFRLNRFLLKVSIGQTPEELQELFDTVIDGEDKNSDEYEKYVEEFKKIKQALNDTKTGQDLIPSFNKYSGLEFTKKNMLKAIDIVINYLKHISLDSYDSQAVIRLKELKTELNDSI